MSELEKRLLTIEEAAKLLSLKVSRLRTAVFRREIPFIKIGRLVRFKEDTLHKWMDDMTRKTLAEEEDSWF